MFKQKFVNKFNKKTNKIVHYINYVDYLFYKDNPFYNDLTKLFNRSNFNLEMTELKFLLENRLNERIIYNRNNW